MSDAGLEARARLRKYVTGLSKSGVLDGWAYSEIVTPDVVLRLLNQIDEVERAIKGGEWLSDGFLLHDPEAQKVVKAFGGPEE